MATRPTACVTPSCLRSSPRLDASTVSYSGSFSTSPTRKPPTLSRPLVRPSMLNLRFTAGVGVGISGACELPLAWRAHKPLPWALRSSAALALGRATLRAPATELVEPLPEPPQDAAFSSLFSLFSISLLIRTLFTLVFALRALSGLTARHAWLRQARLRRTRLAVSRPGACGSSLRRSGRPFAFLLL